MKKELVRDLFAYIQESPTACHTVEATRRRLEEKGFTELYEQNAWSLKPGGKYFVCRSMTSIIAFTYPKKNFSAFSIVAPHGDSPCFKIKESPELEVEGQYTKLNTEVYGGMDISRWVDRPLSAAGRLLVRSKKGVKAVLVDRQEDLFLIPGLAIHMTRGAEDGGKPDPSKDTLPLLGLGKVDFVALMAESAGVNREDVLSYDLYAYNRARGAVVGAEKELICAPKLDDLECAFSAVTALTACEETENVQVCAIFDNEEIGSMTRQGAFSTFLKSTLERICELDGKSGEESLRAIAGSFMLSADNAHAVHPNYTEKSDFTNRCYLNGGVVVKHSPKYATDAITAAVFQEICARAKVPTQVYYNRSNLPGGSTLGNISNTQVSLPTVDIGLAQLSMHSPYETGGKKDLSYMVSAMTGFYNSRILTRDNLSFEIR